MQTVCEHKKTVIIARRDGVDYLECLDCRQIFEAEDLEPVTVAFAWQRTGTPPAAVEDCLCPKDLAARLIHSLFHGDEQGAGIPVPIEQIPQRQALLASA